MCRIFKRNISAKKAINAPWREVPSAKSRTVENMNFRATTNIDINRYFDDDEQSSYITFTSNNSFINFDHVNDTQNFDQSQMSHTDRFMTNFCNSTDLPPSTDHNSSANVSPSSSSFSDFDEDATDLFGYEKWEELKSILECDFDSWMSFKLKGSLVLIIWKSKFKSLILFLSIEIIVCTCKNESIEIETKFQVKILLDLKKQRGF